MSIARPNGRTTTAPKPSLRRSSPFAGSSTVPSRFLQCHYYGTLHNQCLSYGYGYGYSPIRLHATEVPDSERAAHVLVPRAMLLTRASVSKAAAWQSARSSCKSTIVAMDHKQAAWRKAQGTQRRAGLQPAAALRPQQKQKVESQVKQGWLLHSSTAEWQAVPLCASRPQLHSTPAGIAGRAEAAGPTLLLEAAAASSRVKDSEETAVWPQVAKSFRVVEL